MKRLLLLLFLFISLVTKAQTGTLRGHVTAEGTPLELATVALLKTSYSTTTDSAGNFILPKIPAGKYQLKVAFIGHENFQETIEVTDTGRSIIFIQLVPLAARLNELVVTGSLREVTKLQSVTPVDVYSLKYFQRNPANNIWDALSNVNGIFPDVDNGVSNTTDIQVNGLEGNFTMILIDGVPAMNGLAGIYALNALPVSMIDKVEIVKGASSTLYGSEAIAGVINIKTKNPGTSPRLNTNVYLTSMLETNIDVTTAFKLKKASTLLSASGAFNNYRWDINSDNFMDVPLTNRANLYNKWNFNRRDSGVAFAYGRFLFEDRLGGQYNMPGRLIGSDSFYTEWIRTYQWQAGFQYQLPLKEKVLLQADYSEHYQQASYGINRFSGQQRSVFSQLTWAKKTDKLNDLLMGAAYRMGSYTDNTTLSSDSVTGFGKVWHIGSLFFEDELNIAKGHKLLGGVRFDYNNRIGGVFSPRINYKWNSIDESNTVRLGLGTGYRIPNVLNEGFGALNGSRIITIPEPLKPERVVTASASYNRVQQLTGGLLNIDISLFYTYFFNFVEPDYGDEPDLIVYENHRGAHAPGISAYGDFTFNYPLKVGIGFTYTHVREVEIDEEGNKTLNLIEHSVPFMANFYLSYKFPGPQLSLDWTGTLISPMLLATVPGDFRPEHSPWYTIQNIQVTKRFKNGIEIFGGIKNLFNFIQKDPILRPNDPFNRRVNDPINNPSNYRFDTTYGYTSTEGIKGFVGLRYTLL